MTLAAATLALAACDPPSEEPSASAAPAPAVTVTATVTVTAAPIPAPAAPDYGFTFFEQAHIGSTFSQMSAQLHYPVAGIEACPHYGPIWNSEIATTYAFTNAMNPGTGVTFFYTNRFLGPATGPWPVNAEGVGIGSTQAELLAAYPSAVVGSVEDLGAGLIATVTVADPDSSSKYVFGFSGGSSTVDLLQWGPSAGGQWSHLCGGF